MAEEKNPSCRLTNLTGVIEWKQSPPMRYELDDTLELIKKRLDDVEKKIMAMPCMTPACQHCAGKKSN